MSRTKLDSSTTGFAVFKAKRHGVQGEMGSSVLYKGWSSDEVLRQLAVDCCPIGTEINGLPQVITSSLGKAVARPGSPEVHDRPFLERW